MEFFRINLCRFVAFAFFGEDMKKYRSIDVGDWVVNDESLQGKFGY